MQLRQVALEQRPFPVRCEGDLPSCQGWECLPNLPGNIDRFPAIPTTKLLQEDPLGLQLSGAVGWRGQAAGCKPSLQTTPSTARPAELRTCSPCPSAAGGCHPTKTQSLGWAQSRLAAATGLEDTLAAFSLLLRPATCSELRLWVIFPSLFSSAAGVGASPGSAGLMFPRQ